MIGVLKALTIAGLAIWAILAAACLFMISLGTDEAWTMIGVRVWLCESPIRDLHTSPQWTSGGMFTIIHILLEAAGLTQPWVQRLPSGLALAGILAIVWWSVARASGSGFAGLLAICPMIGVGDTAVIGTTALGTSLATLVFLATVIAWTRDDSPGPLRVVLCGLFFGLAVSTRMDLLLLVPTVVLVGMVRTDPRLGIRLKVPAREFVVAVLTVAVVAFNVGIHRAWAVRFYEWSLNNDLETAGIGSSLLQAFILYPQTLDKFLMATDAMPLPLLVAASLVPLFLIVRQPGDSPEIRPAFQPRTLIFLLVFGWLAWLAWVTRAKPAYLRYLWPSLESFALVLGVALAWLYGKANGANRKLGMAACLLVALACEAGAIGLTARGLIEGSQDYLAWERSRNMGFQSYRRFRHHIDQAALAHYVKTSIPGNETVCMMEQAMWLRYLADRPVLAVRFAGDRSGPAGPVHLVMTPTQYVDLPTPEAYLWLEKNARLEAQFGRYSVYLLPSGLPDEGASFHLWTYEHPLSAPWWNYKQAGKPRGEIAPQKDAVKTLD